MSAVRRPIGVALLAVLLGALGFVLAPATTSSAAPNGNGFVLASNGSLVPLQVSPGSVVAMPALPVTGVVAGQSLVGIDFRPATGGLVGIGVDLATGTASVYTIATGSNPAVATAVAAPFALDAPFPAGTTFGVDFNPIVDLLRVVSSTGGNYRVNPSTGALTLEDTSLAYVPAEANAPAVASAGYTNDFGAGQTTASGAKATTLYALDGAKDALVAIDNPNGGQVRTIGALGIDIATDAELDITANGLTYALVSTANGDQLRTINLTTGAAGAELATISLGGGVTSVGLAIETGTASPVPAGEDGYIVTADGTLASFELNLPPTAPSPGTLTTVGPITGLASGFTVEGIDTRPGDGVLWGVAVNGTQAQLFTLNTTTAVATPFAAAFTITPGTDYGFDFNPTVDRIRFITSSGANYRLNPTVVGAVSPVVLNSGNPFDGNVNGTPTPSLTSTAYTNSFPGAASTIHLGIDDANDSLVAFTNSNAGTVKTVAALSVATSGDTGLDVATDGRVFFVNGATVNTLNPITGTATSLGTLTTGTPRAFAIGRNQVPRAAVTITANDQTRAFGTANPGLTFTVTGVAQGDTLDTAPTCTTTATPSSPVGPYPITCSGAADPAYTFTYVPGTLTVTPAATTLELKAPISLQGRIAISIGSASATLRTAAGAPVANAPITFSAGGRPLCTATTNASGVARCTFNVLGVVRVFASNGYQASYAGNGNLAGTTGSTPLIR